MSTPDLPADVAAARAIAHAAATGDHRLTDNEALLLFSSADMLHLGAAASAMRERLHPKGEVTFIVDRNVNYTNVCVSGCRFCAFYRNADDPEAFVLTAEELSAKVAETLDLDGTAILLQGGMHPNLGIEWYEEMLRCLKKDHPSIHIHGFGPPEIVHIASLSGMSFREVLERLRAAGLDTLPGGGAEILSERPRRALSPHKATAEEWIEVMRQAHAIDMSTTATMMFGGGETPDERIEHLHRVRDLQDESAAADHVGFRAFIPWSFQPSNTPMAVQAGATGGTIAQAASGWEYLRMLAVARLYLDNVPNIQASWVTQGPKIGQVALAFGANDMGSTMIEENVVAAAGVRFSANRDELVWMIRDAGFTPVQRDTLYREVRRFE